MKFEWQEAKLYWQKKENWHDYGKIVCGKHKFVFKKKDNKNEFILITYMYKTDVDTLEGNLLKTVRYWQWKN